MTYNKATKDLINALTVNELYTITSRKTGYVFMSNERDCYVFTSEEGAKKFCIKNTMCSYSKTGYVAPLDYLAILYRYGFIQIVIDDFKTCRIAEEFGHKYFCNPNLNSVIFLLKQSGKKNDLVHLKNCTFLLPVRIKNFKNHLPEISFPEAKKNTNFIYLPVFSDLEEYSQWEQATQWTPVLLSFSRIIKHAKHDGIIINPSSNRLTINKELMNIINLDSAQDKK